MIYLVVLIIAVCAWKCFSRDTKCLIMGTSNRTGEDILLSANKGLDLVEESLDITPEYKEALLKRYSTSTQPATKRK